MNEYISGSLVDLCFATVRQRILFWVVCLRGIRLPLFQNISYVSDIILIECFRNIIPFCIFIPVLLYSIFFLGMKVVTQD